jgi:hypothetical protein
MNFKKHLILNLDIVQWWTVNGTENLKRNRYMYDRFAVRIRNDILRKQTGI